MIMLLLQSGSSCGHPKEASPLHTFRCCGVPIVNPYSCSCWIVCSTPSGLHLLQFLDKTVQAEGVNVIPTPNHRLVHQVSVFTSPGYRLVHLHPRPVAYCDTRSSPVGTRYGQACCELGFGNILVLVLVFTT